MRKFYICDFSKEKILKSYVTGWWIGDEIAACSAMSGGGPEESLNNCESSGHLYTGSQRGEDKAENLSGWITQNN